MPKALIPLADGCEELEAVTLIDLLRRASIEVITASLKDAPVHCSRGTRLLADCLLDDVLEQHFDLFVLPGGLPGADNLNTDARIHTLIRRLEAEGCYIAAICAAPKVLVENGILKGRTLTAYPGSLAAIDTSHVHLTQQPIVIDGKVITSRGPGTAMDFSLQLIELLTDKTVRDRVEAGLQRP
ncbi:4-methyl-5(b-hydroxyethyl)-thiazole monophosphate biosynthesis [Thiothrix caldifontis]|jgi:DJ-1 family protein|uniref:4-methyl-5(B-hydroxyethyl)-thiazole monophosphate biosynthesis n=1 Tax=Thiothrix caldifontis TaxID=525918 RepID=A0A1H3XE20_9GAMM|nr:DJ-1 family glyoxalase III [Thiothrix caldifontis]SDZ96788.1 4-methyl-5(b-hydroxyethyl)-thiazole monophosphate biosynthesis [Thiothrix caldifontis]